MRHPFGLSFPIRIETAHTYVQPPAVGPVAAVPLPVVGPVAAVLPAAEDVAGALVRGIAGLAGMESAERHTHRGSAEDQLAVCPQILAAASQSMLSELPVDLRWRITLAAVRLPVSTRCGVAGCGVAGSGMAGCGVAVCGVAGYRVAG